MLCTSKERAFDPRALHCSTGWLGKKRGRGYSIYLRAGRVRSLAPERLVDVYNGPTVRAAITFQKTIQPKESDSPAGLFRRAINGFHYRGIDG
jgi:hypothetical protein